MRKEFRIMTSDSFHCPECGADVSPNATGCRCGARKENGRWLTSETYDGVDLPDDDDFDYQDFIAREFGEGTKKRSFRDFFWWLVALITLIAFILISIGW